jgi:hypothetical protein
MEDDETGVRVLSVNVGDLSFSTWETKAARHGAGSGAGVAIVLWCK